MPRGTPIPDGWRPDQQQRDRLAAEFGKELDLNLTWRRFVAYYRARGTYSVDWAAQFDLWVVGDAERVRAKQAADAAAPDEFGMYPWQRGRS